MQYNKKLLAVVVAVIGCIFWYQPFTGGVISRTGVYFGDLAYGLLALPVLFMIATWMQQKTISLIFSGLYVLLSGCFAYDIGVDRIGLGLIGIMACSIASVYIGTMKK